MAFLWATGFYPAVLCSAKLTVSKEWIFNWLERLSPKRKLTHFRVKTKWQVRYLLLNSKILARKYLLTSQPRFIKHFILNSVSVFQEYDCQWTSRAITSASPKSVKSDHGSRRRSISSFLASYHYFCKQLIFHFTYEECLGHLLLDYVVACTSSVY